MQKVSSVFYDLYGAKRLNECLAQTKEMAKGKTTATATATRSAPSKQPKKAATKAAPSSKAAGKAPATAVSRDSTAYFKFGTYFKKILIARFGNEKSEKGRKTSSKEAIAVLNTLTISMISCFRLKLKKIAAGSQRLTIMKEDVDTLASILLTNDLVQKYNVYRTRYDALANAGMEKDKFNSEKAKLLIIPTARVEKTLRGKSQEQGGKPVTASEGDPALESYLKAKEEHSQKTKKEGKKSPVFGFKVASAAIISCTCLVRVLLDDILGRAGEEAERHNKVMIKVSHIYEALKANQSAALIFCNVMPDVVNAVEKEKAAREAAKAAREGTKEKKAAVVKKKKEKKAPTATTTTTSEAPAK